VTAKFISVQIPFDPESPMISGWLYIAWLAYPDEKDAGRRQDLHEALGAWVYKSQGKNAPIPFRRFKRTKAEAIVKRGLQRADRRVLAAWVFLKHLATGTSVNAACELATNAAGRTAYDPEQNPDTFEAIWPKALEQATPDKNVRRAYYEARPILPMYFAMPILPESVRMAAFPYLEGRNLQSRTMQEAAFSDDWVWIACRDANQIIDRSKDHDVFAAAKILVPTR
jgi:hypothetical protein